MAAIVVLSLTQRNCTITQAEAAWKTLLEYGRGLCATGTFFKDEENGMLAATECGD
jgi:hypothetical protein